MSTNPNETVQPVPDVDAAGKGPEGPVVPAGTPPAAGTDPDHAFPGTGEPGEDKGPNSRPEDAPSEDGSGA